MNYLERNIDQVAHCVLEKMLSFATGRHLNFADKAELKSLQSKWKLKDYRMRDLIKLVVDSSIFKNH